MSALRQWEIVAFSAGAQPRTITACTYGKRMAQAHHEGIGLEMRDKVMNALLENGFIIPDEPQ
ncbi:hypothetical protein BBI10_02230 [Pseudomonas graminis]|uniref:Uncharacterized protein n=1 Tax=Pseudomonas graminis TaxID=158627 RepID=A0A1C2EEL6_9PSED|nr:hypothetical protein BBI10_02230 [Pseudomonas graminis]